MFAPIGILTLMLVYQLSMLVFIFLCAYLFYVLVRKIFSEKYSKKIALAPKRMRFLFGLTLFLGVIVVLGEIYLVESEEDKKKYLDEHNKKHNPILEKETVFKYMTLPKGTQIHRINRKYRTFITATFPKPFNYKGLLINEITNPDDKGAKVTFVEDTKIGLLLLKKNVKCTYYFSPRVSVNTCTLVDNFTHDGIVWGKGSVASSYKVLRVGKRPYLYIKGNATFMHDNQRVNDEIYYFQYLDNNSFAYFKRGSTTALHRDTNFKHPDAVGLGTSTKDKNGKYSIRFKLMLKNRHYEIVSLTSGKTYHGKSDKEGMTKSIQTDKEERYEVYYRWVNAKKKVHD